MTEKKRVRKKKSPKNSILATKAMIAMPDPSTIDVSDLIPQSVADQAKAVKGGRGSGPNKYTKPTVTAILRNVAIGMPEGRAAELAGIRAGTLSDWKKRWGDLSDALARAAAVAQDELYGVVRKGMNKNPRLALEVLERRFPQEWAAHSKHQVQGVMVQTQVSADMLANLYGARRERDGEEGKSIDV